MECADRARLGGFCFLKIRHGNVRVMCEAKTVNAVGRFEFACGYQRRLVCRDHLLVDRARNLIALHRHRDLLRYGLVLARGLVYGRVRSWCSAAHLKRRRTKTTDDKCTVAV